MLFDDRELVSEFDFGNTVRDEAASLKYLANEICRVTDILSKKENPVKFKHTDNHYKSLYVQAHHTKGENELYYRSSEEICQLLYRTGRTSTIAGFLESEKIGITKPAEGTQEFKEYLQLLYFFYMMRYFAFENDYFFRSFSKPQTSEMSPVEGASQGKYWWFILENLMDDKEAKEIFIHQDFGYSTRISIITDRINQYISEKSFYENEKRAKNVEQVIDGCGRVSPREWHGGVILRAMDAGYQYQMLAYSGDMLRNLDERERPFDFPELEIEAPKIKWQGRLLEYGQIEEFFKEKEVAFYCMQDSGLDRPDKALRNGPTEIVKYIFKKDLKQKCHLFIQEDAEGVVRISALNAAIIARTYIDLSKEKLLVGIKKSNGWNSNVAFRNALASSDGVSRSKVATDLAYRLFVVAFHSELLNTTMGHGYWPALFRPIYLRNHVFVQKCVKTAFSGRNPNEWRDRLQYLIDNLPFYPEPDET